MPEKSNREEDGRTGLHSTVEVGKQGRSCTPKDYWSKGCLSVPLWTECGSLERGGLGGLNRAQKAKMG